MKRVDEAIVEIKRALELEPLSIPMGANLAGAYLYAGNNALALEQARKVNALEPDHITGQIWLVRAYISNGMYEEAIALAGKDEELAIEQVGYAHAKLGRRKDAEEVLRKIEENGKTQSVDRFGIATIYAALGDKEKAIDELEKSFANRDWAIGRISVDRGLDPLRDHPRFKDLVRRMGLPE